VSASVIDKRLVGREIVEERGDYHTANILAVVTVVVVALSRTNIIHLVDRTTLRAALDRTIARHGQPSNNVRVSRAASATNILLVTERANDDGFLHGAGSACVEGLHVENVDTLHLSEDFETLETGGLVDVGGDGTGLGTGGHKVMLVYDL
jgi:hypothetical protein